MPQRDYLRHIKLGQYGDTDLDQGWGKAFFDISKKSGFLDYLVSNKIKCAYFDINGFVSWLKTYHFKTASKDFTELLNVHFLPEELVTYNFIISHLGEGVTYGPTLRLVELLKENGVSEGKIFVMCGGKEEPHPKLNTVHFWEYFIRPPYTVEKGELKEVAQKYYRDLIPSKHFVCLMRRIKLDRVYIYRELNQYSWSTDSKTIDISLGTFKDSTVKEQIGGDIPFFKETLLDKIPVVWDLEHVDDSHQHKLPYNQIYRQMVNVVVETLVTPSYHFYAKMFITEKSLKPFYTYQLPIFIGQPGLVQEMRDLGFDVFDDIFEQHYYDNIFNSHARIATVVELMDKFYRKYSKASLRKLKESLLPRLDKNFELVSSFTTEWNQERFKTKAIELIDRRVASSPKSSYI